MRQIDFRFAFFASMTAFLFMPFLGPVEEIFVQFAALMVLFVSGWRFLVYYEALGYISAMLFDPQDFIGGTAILLQWSSLMVSAFNGNLQAVSAQMPAFSLPFAFPHWAMLPLLFGMVALMVYSTWSFIRTLRRLRKGVKNIVSRRGYVGQR